MNFKYLTLLCLISLAGSLTAHDRYLLPSHTVLSGDGPRAVTITASISNDIFHPDRPFGDQVGGVVPESLQDYFKSLKPIVVLPDGKVEEGQGWRAFARFSVCDLLMEKEGTYRVAMLRPDSYMTTFKKADGSSGRAFGKDAPVPEGAQEVVRWGGSSRVETFVTWNKPTRDALKPTGLGLELGGESHPNDLFTGETAHFQLFIDGKPLEGSHEVHWVRAGTRHRDQRQGQTVTTDERGRFEMKVDQAGFYLLQASVTMDGAPDSGLDQVHHGLFVTLEVFPE